ncbi:MAG: LamG domain-containing protein, partial [Planctomycetaceae bacterium]|nr:LamG domain-containing protein [Planctomycetaceae bacterium]
MQKFFAIALSCLLLSSATAQDWEAHRQSVLTQPTLIRYHLFDGSPTSPNLAPSKDVPNSDLAYQTQHPIEAVREPGTMSPAPSQAVRIDAGWFEGPKLALDKNFCVEMRVRLLAAGTEKGNDNSDNGTLFGLGNGYDNGIRLTTDCPRQTLVFSIGRPEEAKSRNVAGNQPAPYGIWTHIAAAWDGETMRIYVDGMLYAITDFDGKLTEPGWGFRVGFNDAGVGSVKMDIAEVAVYKDALPPEDIFGHALLMPKLPALPARAYHAIIDAIYRKDFIEAMRRVDQLRMVDLQLDGQQRLEYDLAFRKFRADLAAMSGQLSQSLRLSATLLNDPHLPPHVADGLMQRLIPTEYTNPLAVASSSVYKKMKDDPTFNLTERQRFAVEKCYAQALFVEGKTAEAKELLAKLSERERTYNSESLAKQNLSGEFTDLYKKYREDDKPVVPTKLRDVQPTPPPQFSSDQWLFYVAPDGKADNPGTQAEPFGSLIQARDAIRKLKIDKISTSPRRCDVLVLVRSGVYPVTETFVLEAQDSGADTISICYTAGWERTTDGIKMGTPIFTGGVSVSDFQKVDDPKILNRLPKESQGKVVVATISGDVKFPPAAPRGYGKNGLGAAPAVELFIDDQPMQISRYPNAPNPTAENMLKASENSFVTTGKVHRGFFNTNDENVPGIFEYADQRHERWTEAKDAMLYGYWGHLWAPSSTLIEKIDPQTKQVIMATNVACGTRKDMPYYAFNLLEEIDEPGEWYLDRENNKLYVYPPDGTNINSAKVRLSWFPREFIVAKDVSHVTLHGLHFEEGSGNAIRVEGGKNFSIVGCTAKRFGNWGLGLSGKNHSVVSCDFVTLGGGGINLNGGDVRTLTPGNCLVENTMVNDFSRVDRCYAPAVSMNGVGNRLAHNLFCDSPG